MSCWQVRSAKRVHPSKLCIGLAAPVSGAEGQIGSYSVQGVISLWIGKAILFVNIWGSEFETRWIDIYYFNLWVSPNYLQLRFVLCNLQVLPFFSWFLVVFWGFACLSSWFLLEFLGPACNDGTYRTGPDQAWPPGHERHERQWVSERSEADTELGPSSWSGEILFGRLYFWQKLSECNQHGRNKKIRKVLHFWEKQMAYMNLPKFMVPPIFGCKYRRGFRIHPGIPSIPWDFHQEVQVPAASVSADAAVVGKPGDSGESVSRVARQSGELKHQKTSSCGCGRSYASFFCMETASYGQFLF